MIKDTSVHFKTTTPLILLLLTLIPLSLSFSQASQTASLTVYGDKPGPKISPNLYGLFFEEINSAGDGGLYGELIRNRSFEESNRPDHWRIIKEGMVDAEVSVDSLYSLSEKNEHYLRLKILLALDGYVGVANSGYWGIPLTKGASYDLSFYAMALDGINRSLTVVLESPEEKVLASATVTGLVADWKKLAATLVPEESCPNARLVIRITEPGNLFLDMVSLFPQDTYKNRPNGLRRDLAEMMANLQPSFIRFPGGCWVEGEDLKHAYRWKETIGNIADRRTQYNLWQYHSTNGLGFHEYLQMCEDLNAEPLFVINCGMSHNGFVPLNDMKPWVRDALDAIEYANGRVDSRWGSVRARNGRLESFNLKYIEIGNENGGPVYAERYALFHDAIKAKYPDVRVIANVWGGYPKNRPIEIIDEHYYASARFFINNATRYDSYDRKGPKVYVGEYAVTQGAGNGNLRAALGEAAFMTGLERNSDIVVMSSYAPLFANVNFKRWNPDLINFDGTRVYGTPSYYVQHLFATNRGDVVLPTELSESDPPPEPPHVRNGKIGVGTWRTQAEFRDIEVSMNGETVYESDFESGAKEWTPWGGDWKLVDGFLRQTGTGTSLKAVAGNSTWRDYTLTLKARKLGGVEGFLILFSVKDEDNFVWWNVGGWGNSRHAIEFSEDGGKSVLGTERPGSVETGRWYDIRVELKDQTIKCFLDGKLVHDLSYDVSQPRSLHAIAGKVMSTGEIILKVVNVSKNPVETTVDLQRVGSVNSVAQGIVLTSASPTDENSLVEPKKVFPHSFLFVDAGQKFKYTFPPHSVTLLRLKTAP